MATRRRAAAAEDEAVLLDSVEQDRTIAQLLAQNEADSRFARRALALVCLTCACVFAQFRSVGYVPADLTRPSSSTVRLLHACSALSMLGTLFFLRTRQRIIAALSLTVSTVPLVRWGSVLSADGVLFSAHLWLPLGPALVVGMTWHLEMEHRSCAEKIEELKAHRYHFKKV